MNGPRVMCVACEKEILGVDNRCACDASEALRELVELKRIKDLQGETLEYRRRKILAWQTAFRLCGVIADPKP